MVAGEVLRRRVDDESRPARARAGRPASQRSRRRRRGRGARGGLEVGHRQQRVRRRLDPDEVGAGRRRPGLVVLDVPSPQRSSSREEHAGAEVGALRERDRRAGPRAARARPPSRRPCRTRKQRVAALELAERALRRDAGRVRVPRVVERRPARRRSYGQIVERSSGGSIAGDRVSAPALADGRERIHDTTRREARLAARSCSEQAAHAGTEKAVARSGSGGKLLARERVEKLLRPGLVRRARPLRPPPRARLRDSMANRPYGDAVVTGYGEIFGRRVFVFCRTSPSSAARSPRCSPRRSAR